MITQFCRCRSQQGTVLSSTISDHNYNILHIRSVTIFFPKNFVTHVLDGLASSSTYIIQKI